MKDFGFLFIFYDVEKNPTKECLVKMQQKFDELIPTIIIEKCPNYLKQLTKLINLSDKNNANIEIFMKDVIEKKFEVKVVNFIYIQLVEDSQSLSDKCKNEIVNFFTKNKTNSKPNNLVDLIEKCEKLRNDIFSKLDKYIIKEEDFFHIEATDNYIIYKNLVKKDLLKNTQGKKNNYISKTLDLVLNLQEKLKKNEVNYKTIIVFFIDDKSIELLEKRIKYIFFNDKENKSNEIFTNIKSKINEIRTYIENLEKILSYLLDFYSESSTHKKEDIESISDIIEKLKDCNICNFEKKQNENKKYITKYLEDAKKIELKKKSI
jgi:hypothetical protein